MEAKLARPRTSPMPILPIMVFGKSALSSKEGNSGAQKIRDKKKGWDFSFPLITTSTTLPDVTMVTT